MPLALCWGGGRRKEAGVTKKELRLRVRRRQGTEDREIGGRRELLVPWALC